MCDGLIVMAYNREAYMRAAEAIWDAIATESSVVEPVEPEEVFAELSGTGAEACHAAQQIALLISSHAQTEVRVGIGKTKLVARQAASQERRLSDVITVPRGREAAAVAAIPLAALLVKLDAKLLQRMEKLGVHTLGDVAALPESVLQQHRSRKLREVWHMLRRLAAGDDGDRVRALWPKPKIERSHRFEDEAEAGSEEQARMALRRLAEEIASSLEKRGHGLTYCRSLALTICLIDGSYLTETERLIFPTCDIDHINAAAVRLLGRMRSIYRVDQPILEFVLIASDLDGGSQSQLAFNSYDEKSARREQQARLESVLARLWRKFGSRAVITAALLSQAKRIHLWTHVLARLRSEPIHVYTNRKGAPVRYLRRGRGPSRRKEVDAYDVAEVIDTWRTTDWKWGRLIECDCWRVLASPGGIHELHKLEVEWVLEAEAD